MNRLSNMQAFVRVVETGSFAEAGRRLGLSKSVVTKRVNQIEAELGVQLLRRSTRRLSITDAGVTYYERCLTILSDVNDAEAQASAMNVQPHGRLRVSCSSAISVAFLARDLCTFQLRHSGLSIELIHNDRAVNPIHENFDICFQVLDVNAEMVAKQTIMPLRVLLCAAPKYLEKHGTPRHPSELSQHRCAHNIYLEPKTEWCLAGENETVVVPLDPIITTNNAWMMRDAVCNGNCIAPMPPFFAEAEFARGDIVPILTNYRLQDFSMIAFYPRSQHVPVKTRLFLEYLTALYDPLPPWEKRLAKLSI